MAKSYREALAIQSRKLLASAETSFDHKTARGDLREFNVRDFLRPRLGATFEIAKGEVIDSEGESAGEFDGIIYDRSTGACIETAPGERHIVRVESVAAIVEAKTTLQSSHLEEMFKDGNKNLRNLRRYYEPTDFYDLTLNIGPIEKRDETREVLAKGVGTEFRSKKVPIPTIPSFIIAG